MSAEGYRYKGVARNGKIELEPGAVVPDGAEVIVLFEPATPKTMPGGKRLGTGFSN